MLSFLFRMWLTGWLWARMAPYVLVALLIFCFVLTWLTNSFYCWIGLDKIIRVKNGHIE